MKFLLTHIVFNISKVVLVFCINGDGVYGGENTRKNVAQFMIRWTIQIQRKKLEAIYHKDFCRNLLKLRKLSDKFVSGYVIYSGDLTPEIDGIKYLNFKETASAVS